MIAFVTPFNPAALSDYLPGYNNVVSINSTASSVNNIVKALLQAGVKVIVYTLDYYGSPSIIYEGNNLEVHVIGVKTNRFTRLFPNLYKSANILQKHISKDLDRIDVVHAQWCYEYALAASKFIGTKKVYCTIRDWAPVIYANLNGTANIKSFLVKAYWIYKKRLFNKIIDNNSILFVANSEYTRDLFTNRYHDRSIALIHNSVEDEQILEEECIPQRGEPLFVSIAGDLDEKRKNLKPLIEAFSIFYNKYHEGKLVLIGHCAKDGIVNNTITNLNITNVVTCTGPLARAQIIDYIDKSSCLVHPAIEETFGNTLIEGMMRCKPVIGGEKSGAVPYVLSFGKCGFLCDILSPLAIEEAMATAVYDRQKSAEVINEATNKLYRDYSNSVIAQKHKNLYRINS